MAAPSWARRSGERFSFLFTVPAGFFFGASTVFLEGFAFERLFLTGVEDLAERRAAPAVRESNFFFAFRAPAFSIAANFRFHLASFPGPFCSRVSSLRIFFLRVLRFIGIPIMLPRTSLVDQMQRRLQSQGGAQTTRAAYGAAFQSSAGSMTERGPVPFNHARASFSPRKYASQNAVDSARITR